MKRILSTAFAAVIAIGLNAAMVGDAEAKRLGGGSSSGMKRDSSIMKRDAAPTQNTAPTQAAKPAPAAAPTAAPARSGMSRWLGPIAGLAAGLGLAALFSHLGMGEEMANFAMLLLMAMAVFFIVRMFLRKRQPQGAMQYAGAGNNGFQDTMQLNQGYEAAAPGAAASAPVGHIPADFDAAGFVRQAKLNFVRLQAANDRGDMDDVKNFTSPEMFAEIQMQYQERGRIQQQTDVVHLDADLLDVSNEAGQQVASVRFFGQIREEANAAPESFDEVWHLSRPLDGSRGWVISGIQQY